MGQPLSKQLYLICFGCRTFWVITPLKEIEINEIKENLTSVGFEPTTSGLDPPMLYRLSYEASAGVDWGNLDSESRYRSSDALPTELRGQYGSRSR